MAEEKRAVDPLELAKALLTNGDALLSDARYLLDGGRRARAAALALIAMEEFGKIYACLNAIAGEAELPSATSRSWRNHRDKLQTAKALDLGFLDSKPSFDMDLAAAEVEANQRLKMSCLYVDHMLGKIQRPSHATVDAAALVASCQDMSAFLHSILDRVTPDVVSAMADYRPLIEALLDRMIDKQDPEGSVARIRAVTKAAATDDLEGLVAALHAAVESAKVEE